MWNFPEQSQEGLCKKEPSDLKPDRRVKDWALSWVSSPAWETLSYIGVSVLKASRKSTPYPHQNQNLGRVGLEYLMSWPTFCACGCHSGPGYVVIGYRLSVFSHS